MFQPLDAEVIDELPMVSARLLHADARLKTHIRALTYQLKPERYSMPDESFGALPIVGGFGDHLQLPPVPDTAGLFAALEGSSDEHKAGVAIFSRFKHVKALPVSRRYTEPLMPCFSRGGTRRALGRRKSRPRVIAFAIRFFRLAGTARPGDSNVGP